MSILWRHIIALAIAPAATILLFAMPAYLLGGGSLGLVFSLMYGIPISYITVLFFALPITLYLKSINKISMPILAAIGFVLGSLCLIIVLYTDVISNFSFSRLGKAMLNAGIPSAIGAMLYGLISGITDETQQLNIFNKTSKIKLKLLLVVLPLILMLVVWFAAPKNKTSDDIKYKNRDLHSHESFVKG